MNLESKLAKENIPRDVPIKCDRTQEPTRRVVIEAEEKIMDTGMRWVPLDARPLSNGASDATHIRAACLLAT